MRRILGVVVVGLCIVSTTWAYDWSTNPGDGSASNPYQISTAEQLMSIGSDPVLLAKNYILTADIDLSGEIFTSAVIAPDINNSNWGFQGTSFIGVFEGNGHMITRLSVSSSDQDHVGLFGQIGSGGQVINLRLVDLDITGKSCTGGLCGENYGTISQSYATGMVTGDNYTGGLCGFNHGSINQCYATAMMTGDACVGGLCGINEEGSIIKSYATNSVTGNSWIGGLCGSNYGIIIQSYTTSIVVGSDASVGGLCASNFGAITDSYWDIESSGQSGGGGGWGLTRVQMKQAASFAGWNDGTWMIDEGVDTPRLSWENEAGSIINTNYIARTYAGHGTIEDPYQIVDANDLLCLGRRTPDWNSQYILVNDIDLTGVTFTQAVIAGGSGMFTGTFNGNNHVISHLGINGSQQSYIGFFGQIGPGGQVNNLKLTDVNSIGRDYVGGLCGGNNGTINQSYVIGAVTGSFVCIGGLCGVNSGTISQSCFMGMVTGSWWVGGLCGSNEDTIIQTYTIATVTGNMWVGGLVGGNYDMISQSYAAGITIPDSDVGGLCGWNDTGSISNCFWDVQVGSQYYSVGGTGKTTDEMKILSTFTDAGWDFTNTWAICEGTNYPRLQWQIPEADWVCPDGVSLEDLDLFVGWWLMDDCTFDNNYCGGVDIDHSGVVDLADWAVFAGHWMDGV